MMGAAIQCKMFHFCCLFLLNQHASEGPFHIIILSNHFGSRPTEQDCMCVWRTVVVYAGWWLCNSVFAYVHACVCVCMCVCDVYEHVECVCSYRR